MSYILLHSRLLKLRFRCPLQRIFFWFLIENKQVQQLLQKLLLLSIGEESLDKQNCYLDILSKNRCNYEDLLWIFRVLGMSRCRSRLHMPAQKQTKRCTVSHCSESPSLEKTWHHLLTECGKSPWLLQACHWNSQEGNASTEQTRSLYWIQIPYRKWSWIPTKRPW